jgi:Holliday junction resolvase
MLINTKPMPKINSRAKGCRGERLWRDVLREEGFTARRGQQFSGGTESPDVICSELKNLHMEVKFVERLNLEQACEQADRDRGVKPYIVAHKRNRSGWKVTMDASLFFALLRDGMECLKGEWLTKP